MLKLAHLTNVIDGRSNSGTARVARQLIRELSSRSDVHQYLIHFEKSNSDIYSLPNTTEILIPIFGRRYGHHFRSFIWFWGKNRFQRNRLEFDIVHWHSSRVFPLFFLIPSKKTVITLHDAGIRILKGVNTFSTRVFYWNLRVCIRFVDQLLAVSNTAANDLEQAGRFPKQLIDFVYNGSNFSGLRAQVVQDLENPFIVCIARWQSFKNVESIVEGYGVALQNSDRVIPRLVLVGKPVNGYDLPLGAIKKWNLENSVTILEDLADSELAYLLDHAWLNMVPSLHEGFGLIVLEGLSRGCTPVVHKYTATAEIAGECGLKIDMRSHHQIAEVIRNCKPRDLSLEIECRCRADQFTWSNASDKLMKIYAKLLQSQELK